MPSTPTYSFPYPGTGDSPHGPNQLQALAEAVEDKLILVDGSVVLDVASTASVSSPYTDQLVFSQATKCFHRWTGAAWVIYYPGVQWIHKSATESVTSSTTLQNDDHFAFSVAANAIYALEGYVMFDGAADATGPVGGFKHQFVVPSLATMAWTNYAENGFAGGTSSLVDYNVVVQAAAVARSSGTLPTGVATMSMQPKGTLVTGANSGTLQFQWAQTASNATATRVMINSWMKLTRIV